MLEEVGIDREMMAQSLATDAEFSRLFDEYFAEVPGEPDTRHHPDLRNRHKPSG